MNLATTAKRLASLGHEQRLELFRLLVRAGHEGRTIGELQAALGRPASTVSFHLRELVAADLVRQNKEGRTVRCRASFDALNEMLLYVQRNCCADSAAPDVTRRR